MKRYLHKLFDRQSLSTEEAQAAMDYLMMGQAQPEEIGAFLGALRGKGETVDELIGFAKSLRQHAQKIVIRREDLVDTCGTGGDGTETFNISTATALIVAAAGLGVVKHGNRAVSSRCGSADLLMALKLSVELPLEHVVDSVENYGFGFLFAPSFHPAMKYVAPVRKQLGVRTVFNLLGPLVNPVGIKRQVIGVYDGSMIETMAEVLRQLGSEEVMVVAGNDGMDEITTVSTTRVAHLKDGKVSLFTMSPEDVGIRRAKPEDLKGGDPATNAKIVEGILRGLDQGPKRDIVVINAAAALVVGGKVQNLVEGKKLAESLIDQGLVWNLLEKLRLKYGKAPEI